jgi:hypothetical protein
MWHPRRSSDMNAASTPYPRSPAPSRILA